MKVVLDTSVFIRALINPYGVNAQLFQLADRYEVVVSESIIEEILEVVYRSSLRKKYTSMTEIRIEEMLDIIEGAKNAVPKTPIAICRDPNDDRFLECAVEGKVDYLVSADKDLLDMKEYKEIKIISGSEFLKILLERED